MADIEMTQANRLPSLHLQLRDASGPIDLSSATVKWVMMDAKGTNKTDAAATIVAPASLGIVRYDWASADVDTPGRFYGQAEVTVSGKAQNVPSDRHLLVEILESPR